MKKLKGKRFFSRALRVPLVKFFTLSLWPTEVLWERKKMAQASFFVNNVKIVSTKEGFIIEGQRICLGGNLIDRVHVLMPHELKEAFRKWILEGEETMSPVASSLANKEPSQN